MIHFHIGLPPWQILQNVRSNAHGVGWNSNQSPAYVPLTEFLNLCSFDPSPQSQNIMRLKKWPTALLQSSNPEHYNFWAWEYWCPMNCIQIPGEIWIVLLLQCFQDSGFQTNRSSCSIMLHEWKGSVDERIFEAAQFWGESVFGCFLCNNMSSSGTVC